LERVLREEPMTDKPRPPAELIAHLNHRDCVLFVGDALDEEGAQSTRLASILRRSITPVTSKLGRVGRLSLSAQIRKGFYDKRKQRLKKLEV
jgi:hypothetical protein